MPIITKTIPAYRCDKCGDETTEEDNFAVIAAGTRLGTTVCTEQTVLCRDCLTEMAVSPTKSGAARPAQAIRLEVDTNNTVIQELIALEKRIEAEQALEMARRERDEYNNRARSERNDYNNRREPDGHGGATGRPFATRSELNGTANSDWYTLQLPSGSLPACSRGRGKSLCDSDGRSTLLARLLSYQTPAT